MRKKILLFLCPFLILLLFCFFRSSDTYVIKMRLNKGDTFVHNDNVHLNMSTAGMNMKMGMELACIFEVVNADTNSKSLKMTYTNMHMSMDMGNPDLNGNLSDSLMNVASKKIIGNSILLKLSDNNEITDVDATGMKSIMNDPNMDAPTKAKMQNLFSKDQLNNMFGLLFSMYPKNPVRIGESWNAADNTVSMNGLKMNVHIKYTLREVKNNIATVDVDGVIDAKGNIVNGSTTIGMELNGTEKGALSIYLNDGYLKDGAYTMSINGNLDAGGQKMPLSMQADYTMSGQ